jgi:hypothetical protein
MSFPIALLEYGYSTCFCVTSQLRIEPCGTLCIIHVVYYPLIAGKKLEAT